MWDRFQTAGVFVALATGLLLTGCTGLECGSGTHEADGQCLPNILNQCGPGTIYVQGFCVMEGDSSIGITTPPFDTEDDTRDADDDVPTQPVGIGTD